MVIVVTMAIGVGVLAYRQMDDGRPVPLLADVVTALRRDTTARRRLAGGGVLIAFVLLGITWGLMPVNPSRFRGKYDDAKVAAAGPLTNLWLALFAVVMRSAISGILLRSHRRPPRCPTG